MKSSYVSVGAGVIIVSAILYLAFMLVGSVGSVLEADTDVAADTDTDLLTVVVYQDTDTDVVDTDIVDTDVEAVE